MKMHVDPAIAIIKQALEAKKGQVAADPDKYRQLLRSLSTADTRIYEESFGKTINSDLKGDEAAYKTMLATCAELKSGCTMVKLHVQPTSELMPLVFMVRENIPAYKQVVEATVAQATAVAVAAGITPQIIYRFDDQTKAPYRIIEKSLTKGPKSEHDLDCSKVLDVFGCIIVCADYVSMAAVVGTFAAKHTSGELQLTRVKDRWTTPSSGGWRDLMLNLVVNGIVFEVQIVHSRMLNARTGMDVHEAYRDFRSFTEIFGLLGLSLEIDAVAVDGASGGGGGGGGKTLDFKDLDADGDGVVTLKEFETWRDSGSGGGGGAAAHPSKRQRLDTDGDIAQLRIELAASQAAHAAERVAHAAAHAEVLRLKQMYEK